MQLAYAYLHLEITSLHKDPLNQQGKKLLLASPPQLENQSLIRLIKCYKCFWAHSQNFKSYIKNVSQLLWLKIKAVLQLLLRHPNTFILESLLPTLYNLDSCSLFRTKFKCLFATKSHQAKNSTFFDVTLHLLAICLTVVFMLFLLSPATHSQCLVEKAAQGRSVLHRSFLQTAGSCTPLANGWGVELKLNEV